MTRADELDALAERVERLTVADREIDADVAEKLYGWKPAQVGADYDGKDACEILTQDGKLIPGFAYPPKGKIHRAYHVPDYTRDCRDSALDRAIVRKLLASDIRAQASIIREAGR